MCNLYSLTKSQQAIREWASVMVDRDRTGDLPPMPGIFPDYSAPIVRNQPDGRELALVRVDRHWNDGASVPECRGKQRMSR